MAEKNKREIEKQLPPLCAAVKKIRQSYGDTLARFSQRVGISVNSASRFELGKAVPRDPAVLSRLFGAASEKGLQHEMTVFRDAVRQKGNQAQTVYPHSAREPTTLRQWRILAAVRILNTYYPEHIPTLIEALGPALAIVDTALREVKNPDEINYAVLEGRVNRMAEQQVFLEIQQELQLELRQGKEK